MVNTIGYQEAAAEVIQHYAGHIAQYLGDGLLVYFGYPTAHEDDARRAVHTGLGIVQAITTLNTRLATQYRVQLAVRLGIHPGPVVVGVMGGGGRHEHLALGETSNVAARLQTLAPANAVVLSAVTARLVQGAFPLEELGTHTLSGVAEPMTVSRVRGLRAPTSPDEEFFTAAVPVLEEARQRAAQAVELACQYQQRGWQAWALWLLGESTAHQASPAREPAAGHYRQALTLAEVLGMRPLQAHCHRGLGTLYATTGQQEQARTALSTVIELYRAMEMTFWQPQAEAALAQVDAR